MSYDSSNLEIWKDPVTFLKYYKLLTGNYNSENLVKNKLASLLLYIHLLTLNRKLN